MIKKPSNNPFIAPDVPVSDTISEPQYPGNHYALIAIVVFVLAVLGVGIVWWTTFTSGPIPDIVESTPPQNTDTPDTDPTVVMTESEQLQVLDSMAVADQEEENMSAPVISEQRTMLDRMDVQEEEQVSLSSDAQLNLLDAM